MDKPLNIKQLDLSFGCGCGCGGSCGTGYGSGTGCFRACGSSSGSQGPIGPRGPQGPVGPPLTQVAATIYTTVPQTILTGTALANPVPIVFSTIDPSLGGTTLVNNQLILPTIGTYLLEYQIEYTLFKTSAVALSAIMSMEFELYDGSTLSPITIGDYITAVAAAAATGLAGGSTLAYSYLVTTTTANTPISMALSRVTPTITRLNVFDANITAVRVS